MGSVANLTTNGVYSSPVHRGLWVSERLLGRTLPPPPPGIEPIEPDLRGTTSILEQLEVHARSEACAGCHARFDPYGVPLEELDVVGGLRRSYRGVLVEQPPGSSHKRITRFDRAEVVARATLPDGSEVEGVRGLQQWLLEHDVVFARCLTSKLLTFATGRKMLPEDAPAVESILERAGGPAAGLRRLVEEVVASELFRSNGPPPPTPRPVR